MHASAAVKSAIGPAYMIPSIPKNNGKIKISGNRKRICRVRDKMIPFLGLPIAVKKFDEIGCIKQIQIKNKNILK